MIRGFPSLILIDCIHVAKIEDKDLPIPKVDTIISEPIGVLLFHERMVGNQNISLYTPGALAMA